MLALVTPLAHAEIDVWNPAKYNVGFLLHLLQFILVIGTDDRAIIKPYSGILLQLFHVTWHIIIGQKGGVCATYAMNPRNSKLK